MFEIGAPEVGEVVSGRKKLKPFTKNVETKTVPKQLGVREKNLCVELVELYSFFEKVN